MCIRDSPGTEVPGLGDRAVYIESFANALYVAKGDITLEIFMQPTTRSGQGFVSDAEELAAMRLVAAEALSNL